MSLPASARALVGHLADHNWTFRVSHAIDTGDHPYITIEGKHADGRAVTVTWHTRRPYSDRHRSDYDQPGPYRLFHATIGQNLGSQRAPISKVIDYVDGVAA